MTATTTAWTAEDVLDEATAATGLADFGSDGFREGLDIYCTAVAEEAELSVFGSMAVRSAVVASLASRLRILDWARRHPEVTEDAVVAPLVVIGMFRAGTTFLSYLLDHDPDNRALLRWEAMDSVPPPTPETFRAGPRVEAVREANEMLEALNPAVRAIHHEEPNGPTECIAVMAQDFKSLSWEAITNVPTYGTWLLASDQRSAYEHHRRALQVLQSGGVTGRWTLKSPHHAIALDALTAVYPDARLVLLHRDPVVLCASVCSLIRTMSGTFTDTDHGAYIAEKWTRLLECSIERIAAFRQAHPEHPVLDLHYADLVADPIGTVERVYAAYGDELGGAARAAMAEHVAAKPANRFGVHRYDLASLGLEEGALRERFAGYAERYAVATETV